MTQITLGASRTTEYWRLVGDFASWCQTNHLQINTLENKELVIDFGTSRPRLQPGVLEGDEVEALDYKYLWLWLDNKLDWTTHTNHLYKKKTKQDVLPEETVVLQHLQQTPADVIPVCGCQCPLLHCGVLGEGGGGAAYPKRTLPDWTN